MGESDSPESCSRRVQLDAGRRRMVKALDREWMDPIPGREPHAVGHGVGKQLPDDGDARLERPAERERVPVEAHGEGSAGRVGNSRWSWEGRSRHALRQEAGRETHGDERAHRPPELLRNGHRGL